MSDEIERIRRTIERCGVRPIPVDDARTLLERHDYYKRNYEMAEEECTDERERANAAEARLREQAEDTRAQISARNKAEFRVRELEAQIRAIQRDWEDALAEATESERETRERALTELADKLFQNGCMGRFVYRSEIVPKPRITAADLPKLPRETADELFELLRETRGEPDDD